MNLKSYLLFTFYFDPGHQNEHEHRCSASASSKKRSDKCYLRASLSINEKKGWGSFESCEFDEIIPSLSSKVELEFRSEIYLLLTY